MAKRHCLPSLISVNGKPPLSAQVNFNEWQNATHSPDSFRFFPSCFLKVKRNSGIFKVF